MKTCTKCGETKALSEFSPRACQCKPCRAAMQRDRRTTEGVAEANARAYVKRKERYDREVAVLKARPCADCGGEFPIICMDFDHREGKEFGISAARYRYSIERLLAEVAKCDVVCANCHRIRTANRRLGVAV